MHHDPLLVDRIVRRGAAVLGGEGLDEHELAWVLDVDKRGFQVDSTRRERLIVALAEEAPVTVALAAARGRGVADFLGFCSDEEFHRAVGTDELLIFAFLRWMGGAGRPWSADPRIAALSTLEAAMATLRRLRLLPLPPRCWRRAEGVAALWLPTGILEVFSLLRARIEWRAAQLPGGTAATAAFDTRLNRSALPGLGAGRQGLVLERTDYGTVEVARGTDSLIELLNLFSEPAEDGTAHSLAVRAGADEQVAIELLHELADSGLLVRAGAEP